MDKITNYLIYIFDVKTIFNRLSFIFQVINISNVNANDISNTTIIMAKFNSKGIVLTKTKLDKNLTHGKTYMSCNDKCIISK